VLRHVDGLSTEETPHALRCSTGTVKSQTARGLERLRALLGDGEGHPAGSDDADRREPSYQGENTHD
jgi:DNA-directed RNA polymerase specialized sigma24 family protein